MEQTKDSVFVLAYDIILINPYECGHSGDIILVKRQEIVTSTLGEVEKEVDLE